MAKFAYRSILSGDSEKYISNPGSPYLDQYEFDFDEKGEVKRSTLHKTDKPLNVYDRIQADFDSCDINAIMHRFALGDTSALDVNQGMYIDVTKMPKTFAELFERFNECQRVFDQLDPDVKQLFNNSYEEFWYEFGSDDFKKKIEEYNDRFIDHDYDIDPSPEPDPESEV